VKLFSFSAEIFIIGVNPYVYVPDEVLLGIFKQAGKEKGTIPIKGKINGKNFIQTLVKYQGEWRLYINGIMRKAAKADVGDKVQVEILFDPSSRVESINPMFKIALEKNKKAKEEFEKYSPSRQKEINRYLNNIKNKETLIKNVDRITRYLAGEKVDYFVLLRNKN
jgi:uncharacterized protein YdeI (YjbR/CyaY-like superfamily)